jgi:catechol 2,3-dioxygenase-like lactoylglutathione lyase family enzyme
VPQAKSATFCCVRPTSILETALYGPDVNALEAFYTRVLGLKTIQKLGPQGWALACGPSVLLLFNPRLTARQQGEVPSHGADGRGHIAFSIDPAEFDAWRRHLIRCAVTVESEVDWPRGGQSIYFRDPAGNSIELTTVATWDGNDSALTGDRPR